MPPCIRDTETEKENKCCFWALSIRGLVSLLVCVCVYKGGGCRQTGSRGLQNRTGHHNSSSWSLATDRQAGLNGDGSLIGICHQQPTKTVYPWGKPGPVLTLKQAHSAHYQLKMHTTKIRSFFCHSFQQRCSHFYFSDASGQFIFYKIPHTPT